MLVIWPGVKIALQTCKEGIKKGLRVFYGDVIGLVLSSTRVLITGPATILASIPWINVTDEGT